MRKNFVPVAVFLMLTTMAVSCQKERTIEPQSAVAEIGTVRTVNYSVNGVDHQITLYSDAEWDAFVDSMMSLSEQGKEVCIINEDASTQTSMTKDIQTFTTTDRDEAKAWAKQKADEGYEVTINSKEGVYTCVAVK